MSIRRKVLLVSLVTVVPLTLLVASLLYAWYDAQITALEQGRLNNARLLATSVGTTFEDIGGASRAVGVAILADPPDTGTPQRLQQLVRDFPLHWAAFADTSGRVRYSSDRRLLGTVVEDEAVREAAAGARVVIGDSRVLGGRVGFVIAGIVDDPEGPGRGVDIEFVDPLRLTERLTRNRIIGGAAVVDASGHLVVLFDYPGFASRRPYWGGYRIVREALRGREAIDRDFTFPPTGERRIVAAVPIRPFGWEAGSGIDYDAALAPFLRSLGVAVVIGLAILLASGMAARRLGLSLVDSVAALETQAERVGRHDAERPGVVPSGDELEQVSRVLARTDEDLRAYVSGLEAIGDAGRKLSGSLSSRKVGDAIVETARDLFDAQAVWVLRYDERTGRLGLSVWDSDRGEEPPAGSVRPGQSVAGRAFTSNEMAVVPDASAIEDFAWHDVAERHRGSTLVEIPLECGGRPFGVLGMFVPDHERWRAGGRELGLLRAFGNLVATVLENARLYENERTVADALQHALLTLPDRVPGIAVAHLYHSAAEAARVGGDFYDVFEMEDERIGLVVGDIAGKGLEASVMTSLVKTAVRAHADEPDKTPAQVAALTNELVFKESRPDSFATLFLAYLDRRTGDLTYSNAGHTATALLGREGPVRSLPANSPLVGAVAGLRFEESRAHMDPGDVLFLYTDGLVEARGDSELFGDERLFALLEGLDSRSPEQIVRDVRDAVLAFTDGRLSDDLAILAVQRLAGDQAPERRQVTDPDA